MNNVVNAGEFLKSSREFPEEPKKLILQLTKSYIDIATAVNNKIIGVFPVNRPARDGENWFFTSQRQEGLRQVYAFNVVANNSTIPLGFKLSSISQPTRCWGQYKDSTGNFFGVIWATNVAIAGQLTFYLAPSSGNSDLITFKATGTTPTVVSGFVVIEWISRV